MNLVAEYVGGGHPDRLADQIVARIVSEVIKKDSDALVGLECAVHTNKVFIDGRIAAGKDETVINNQEIENIIRDIYKKEGYCKQYNWIPYYDELEIIQDVCIEKLCDDERNIRKLSDDQNIVLGYALNNPSTNYFPVAHYIVNTIGCKFSDEVNKVINKYGKDFKILVDIDNKDNDYYWNKLTLSIRHHQDISYQEIYSDIKNIIDRILLGFSDTFPHLSSITAEQFCLNGSGDFVQGGPDGDNGLSGKKLVVDFYGPDIPIGGGAIYGKDPHKIDVCGPFKARQEAKRLVMENGFYSVLVKLAWSPGEDKPSTIEAYEIDELGTKIKIDDSLLSPKDNFAIQTINNDLKLNEYEFNDLVLKNPFVKL